MTRLQKIVIVGVMAIASVVACTATGLGLHRAYWTRRPAVRVDLSMLERTPGSELPAPHLELGRHAVMYPYAVYTYKVNHRGDRKPRGDEEVSTALVPIVSADHPAVLDLKRRYGDLGRIPDDAEYPPLTGARMVLQTSAFRYSAEVGGRIVEADSLRLFAGASFPLLSKANLLEEEGIDTSAVVVVDADVRPNGYGDSLIPLSAIVAMIGTAAFLHRQEKGDGEKRQT